MGLKNWLHNKRMSDPVTGQYRLTSCSANSGGAVYENCHMSGVVTAPGIAPTAVEHRCMAPTKRWPQPGQTLPVTVDRADPSRLQIDWDQMTTNRDLGRQLAQQQADLLTGRTPDGAATPGGPAGGLPEQVQSLMESLRSVAEQQGATVTTSVEYSVLGAPGRPAPGAAGGGLTPEQTAAASSGAPSGLQPATARVLAVHDVPVPPGMPGASPGGLVDLTLDVTLPAGSGYATTTRIAFSTPDKRANIAVVGRELPVLVNPAARDQIAIDASRLG